MKGIKFGEYHSFNEWGLVLKEKEIQSPEVKAYQVEVEGGHGFVDMTEFFGSVKFSNRKLKFTFYKPNATPDVFAALYTEMQRAIHGQKMQIIDDDEKGAYFIGRVSIDKWKSNRRIGEIVIEVDAEPFKQEIGVSSYQANVKSNATLSIINAEMPVIPTITSNAEFLISYGGFNEVYPAGTFTIPELEFGAGINQVYVEGTGSITFSYKRGWL